MKATTPWHKYSYLWITLIFFMSSAAGHWLFAWSAYVHEQEQFGLPVEVADYIVQVSRDTLENWQSEFLQLMWQVGGLAALLYIGSPQSREGDERKEAKLDLILKKVDAQNADKLIKQLERRYPKH